MDAFVGTIIPVAFDGAPAGWALCNGQLLPVNQYQALFALLGTTYGGDGRTTFGVPDLCGRTVVGAQGAAPAPLTNFTRGQIVGESMPQATATGAAHATLAANNLPLTTVTGTLNASTLGVQSTLNATSSGTGTASPAAQGLLSNTGSANPSGAVYYTPPTPGTKVDTVDLHPSSVTTTLGGSASATVTIGAGQAIDAPLAMATPPKGYPMQPSVALNYIICLFGLFPTPP